MRYNKFLPTPSVRRATAPAIQGGQPPDISTHALREEGDHTYLTDTGKVVQFLPTPSVRRATSPGMISASSMVRFLPTPSVRRATAGLFQGIHIGLISTHALREEGDAHEAIFFPVPIQFLPTPSVRRATCRSFPRHSPCSYFYPRPP